MKLKKIIFVLVITFLVQSCSILTSKNNGESENKFLKLKNNILPSTAGVYFINGNKLEEITLTYGNKVDFINLPVFQNTNLQFIVYDNNVDENSFFLFDSFGKKLSIDYREIDDPHQKLNMQMVQVKMKEQLKDGYYCFSNDVFVHPEDYTISRPTWCFGYGADEKLGKGISNLDIRPPKNEMGYFLVRKDGLESIPSLVVNESLDLNKLPLIDNYLPEIVYQSVNENPNNVKLYRYRSLVGISYSIFGNLPDGMITGVEKNSGADLAGVLPEDVIKAVNGQDVSGRSDQEIMSLVRSSCVPNKKIDLVLLRGTQQFLAQPVCLLGDFDEVKGIDYILHPDGYAVFRPKYPLFSENIYCLKIFGEKESSCFRVD